MISQELLDKIEETLKDDSGTLLGEKEFDIEELNEMKKHCLIRMRLNQVSELNDNDIKIFIIYIVNKLRDWKKEWTGGKFWERVSDFFDDDSRHMTQRYGTEKIKRGR